jgi:hypothetical protein
VSFAERLRGELDSEVEEILTDNIKLRELLDKARDVIYWYAEPKNHRLTIRDYGKRAREILAEIEPRDLTGH